MTTDVQILGAGLCGLPLADERLLSAATMVNLLGELWASGEPAWRHVLYEPRARLYLYGKRSARPGRKMGHYTVLDADPARARETALALRAKLGIGGGE